MRFESCQAANKYEEGIYVELCHHLCIIMTTNLSFNLERAKKKFSYTLETVIESK